MSTRRDSVRQQQMPTILDELETSPAFALLEEQRSRYSKASYDLGHYTACTSQRAYYLAKWTQRWQKNEMVKPQRYPYF